SRQSSRRSLDRGARAETGPSSRLFLSTAGRRGVPAHAQAGALPGASRMVLFGRHHPESRLLDPRPEPPPRDPRGRGGDPGRRAHGPGRPPTLDARGRPRPGAARLPSPRLVPGATRAPALGLPPGRISPVGGRRPPRRGRAHPSRRHRRALDDILSRERARGGALAQADARRALGGGLSRSLGGARYLSASDALARREESRPGAPRGSGSGPGHARERSDGGALSGAIPRGRPFAFHFFAQWV